MIIDKSFYKLLFFLGFFVNKTIGEPGKVCSIQLLDEGCPETETCVLSETKDTGICVCLPGYNRTGEVCLPSRDNSGGDAESHAHVWTFSILIFIAIVIVGIYFTYKFRMVEWVRCKLNQRYNRSYDDAMIGEDIE